MVDVCLATSRRGRRQRGHYAPASSSTTSSELTGSVKWATVKISDSTNPTTHSIFLGADQVCLTVSLYTGHHLSRKPGNVPILAAVRKMSVILRKVREVSGLLVVYLRPYRYLVASG